MMTEHDSKMAILFRNHGSRSGASLIHPRAPLVVTGVMPHQIRWREEEAERYFDRWGRCVFCDVLALRQEEERRVIAENDPFFGLCALCRRGSFLNWSLPKTHRADFGSIDDAENGIMASFMAPRCDSALDVGLFRSARWRCALVLERIENPGSE